MIFGKTGVHRPADLKVLNRRSIISLISIKAPITVAEIVDKLGISKPTTTMLIKEMVEEKILKEVGLSSSSAIGGKPPMLYEINGVYRYSIIVHIDVDAVNYYLTDMNCSVIAQQRLKISKADVYADWDSILFHLAAELPIFLKNAGVSANSVCYLVIGCGGIVDKEKGISKYPISSCRRLNYPVAEKLSTMLNHSFSIIIDNVGRFSCYAILKEHPELNMKKVAVFDMDYASGGIGGCIIENGKLLYGAHGFLGEFGHIQVETESELVCSCGSKGCLESMLSSCAVKEYWNSIKNSCHEGSEGGERGDLIRIFEEADTGNAGACKIVDRVTTLLSRALRNIMLSYDPDEFVFQGVFAWGGVYFLENLKSKMVIFPNFEKASDIKFSYSTINDSLQSTLIGASLYARNECLFGGE